MGVQQKTGQSNFATMSGRPVRPRSAYETAVCFCGRKALRFVKRTGFCGRHTADAFAAQAIIARQFRITLPD